MSSRCWPLISRYRASVRSQSPKVEMIDSLFKPVSDKDLGIVRFDPRFLFAFELRVLSSLSCQVPWVSEGFTLKF